MHTEPVQPEDVSCIEEWWAIKGSGLPVALLPKHGLCAWDSSDLIAAAWLYPVEMAKGTFGWISWVCLNPDYPKRWKVGAYTLISGMRNYAVMLGMSHVIGTHDSRLLDQAYYQAGFLVGDQNIKQFITKI